jgi:hypothetical protein
VCNCKDCGKPGCKGKSMPNLPNDPTGKSTKDQRKQQKGFYLGWPFSPKPVPIDELLGYRVATNEGVQHQEPGVTTDVIRGNPIGYNPQLGVLGQMLVLPVNPDLEQKRFQMRNAANAYVTLDVTPNHQPSYAIKPNYNRRYVVVPTPQIGLYGVLVDNDNG